MFLGKRWIFRFNKEKIFLGLILMYLFKVLIIIIIIFWFDFDFWSGYKIVWLKYLLGFWMYFELFRYLDVMFFVFKMFFNFGKCFESFFVILRIKIFGLRVKFELYRYIWILIVFL